MRLISWRVFDGAKIEENLDCIGRSWEITWAMFVDDPMGVVVMTEVSNMLCWDPTPDVLSILEKTGKQIYNHIGSNTVGNLLRMVCDIKCSTCPEI